MRYEPFTKEQIEILKHNPYTALISETRIYFTMEFKLFALKEIQNGLNSIKIFEKAGYEPTVLSKQRMYSTIKNIKREAASPEGLRPPRGTKQAERFAKEELSKKKNSTAIKELQERIVYLEQEIEFLKKISLLDMEQKDHD